MEYKRIKRVGEGTYSDVFSTKKEKNMAAMKIYKTSTWNGISVDVIREIATLQTVSSAYIVSLLDMDYVNFSYIILPLYETNLHLYLHSVRPSEECIQYIFHKICLGIYALHSRGIIHRDLKPSNICISHALDKLEVVLIDSGMARKEYYQGDKTAKVTSIWYRAPEVVCNYTLYSFPIDIWAAGCMLAEMYRGKALFPASSELELIDLQTRYVGIPRDLPFSCLVIGSEEGKLQRECALAQASCASACSPLLLLLQGMLNFNPNKRYSIATCLNSTYFSNFDTSIVESEIEYSKYLEQWKSEKTYLNNCVNSEISFLTRRQMVCWMYDLCQHYDIPDSSYFISVLILDFFSISHTDIKQNNYPLVVMASLLIGTKLDSKCPLTSVEIVDFCEETGQQQFTVDQLFTFEKIVLKEVTLNFPNFQNYEYLFRDMNISSYLIMSTLYPEYLKHRFVILVQVLLCIKLDTIPNLQDPEIVSCYDDVRGWLDDYLIHPIKPTNHLFF